MICANAERGLCHRMASLDRNYLILYVAHKYVWRGKDVFIIFIMIWYQQLVHCTWSCFFMQVQNYVIKWKHFPRYWPFVRGIHRSPVNSPHKGKWRGALMFPLICVWINSKQSWDWWFETLSRLVWRHCNVTIENGHIHVKEHWHNRLNAKL